MGLRMMLLLDSLHNCSDLCNVQPAHVRLALKGQLHAGGAISSNDNFTVDIRVWFDKCNGQ